MHKGNKEEFSMWTIITKTFNKGVGKYYGETNDGKLLFKNSLLPNFIDTEFRSNVYQTAYLNFIRITFVIN